MLHTSQTNGFSFCLVRDFFRWLLNCSQPTLEHNGSCPPWVRKCLFRVPFRANFLWHTSHGNRFSLSRICLFDLKLRCPVNLVEAPTDDRGTLSPVLSASVGIPEPMLLNCAGSRLLGIVPSSFLTTCSLVYTSSVNDVDKVFISSRRTPHSGLADVVLSLGVLYWISGTAEFCCWWTGSCAGSLVS